MPLNNEKGTLCIKVNSYHAMESLLNYFGANLPTNLRDRLQQYIFGVDYTSTAHFLYVDDEPTVLRNIK